MRARLGGVALVTAAVAIAIAFGAFRSATGQAQANRVPRTTDGKPNLTGIWQSMTTANWDIQGHESKAGPVVSLGAAFAVQGGPGIVEGNEIPYVPAAAKKKAENAANWMTLDPEVKCYMPGVPRATYMPFPFQIVQGTSPYILMAYEFTGATRIIRMDWKQAAPTDAWMGWSRGRWDGDTLVVDVTGQREETWFDRAGNYHSDALHVVERYTPVSPHHMTYEATIEDPKVFTRPWKISFPLYRRMEKNLQLLEFKCVPFTEELLFGKFRKQAAR